MLEEEEEAKKIHNMTEKEQQKTLDCMMKLMDQQLNEIKACNQEIAEFANEHEQKLEELETDFNSNENKMFKDYHEARIKRIEYQIQEGLCTHEAGMEFLENVDLDHISPEEVQAHNELKQYADQIKARQTKYQLTDVAEIVVDNKMLINKVDEALNQKFTADSGQPYSEIQKIEVI